MSELEDLLKDIDILREQLEQLIDEKEGNLVDQEVVTASKVLNAALNEYNKFIDEKLKKKWALNRALFYYIKKGCGINGQAYR